MSMIENADEVRETHDLIGSDKVEGTKVYRSTGDRIGQIERIMLEKRSDKIAYAVLSFGGFMGMGHDHYPIPWSKLRYNPTLGGYELNITETELQRAPKYSNDDWKWSADQREEVARHYL